MAEDGRLGWYLIKAGFLTKLATGKDVIAKGGSFLEALVSRSKKPAEDGQLIILSGREKASQCYSCHPSDSRNYKFKSFSYLYNEE
ncbi:hypothetical protein L2E82_35479 [Cichorium intybus]|uniref:Uncharacterized protein n=1 Tax=Cichorium intybus TaxID=13427 RepID=A0ACB9BNW6_CICIN|nr:hypothetical protein L2E82_35479 [Cichorium intybus]